MIGHIETLEPEVIQGLAIEPESTSLVLAERELPIESCSKESSFGVRNSQNPKTAKEFFFGRSIGLFS